MPKPIEIFKPGKHTAMSGKVIEFTEAMLKAAAESYDPGAHEAPLVVGHPKENLPAYGWVKGLTFAEGRVLADPDQVDPAFAELVNEGKFKKVSACWYEPDAPANPKPGNYYLRHVGFLGAQPPAIKGLKSASFKEGEAGLVEFSDWCDRSVAGLFRRMRDFMVDQFGLEKADQVLPSYEIDYLQEQAVIKPDTHTTGFIEGASMSPAEIAAKEAELKQREQTLAASETALASKAAEAHKAGLTAFAEALVKKGKLLPKDKAAVVSFMELLPQDAQVVEFAEGGAEKKTPALQLFQNFLGNSPAVVNFGEVAADDRSVEQGQHGLTDQQVADRARAFKAKREEQGTHISYAEAVDAVNAGKDKE
jgi:hypothetical protein